MTESLKRHPFLISQLIRVACLRYQAGAFRKIDVEPDAWRARIASAEIEHSFDTSYLLEAWAVSRTFMKF